MNLLGDINSHEKRAMRPGFPLHSRVDYPRRESGTPLSLAQRYPAVKGPDIPETGPGTFLPPLVCWIRVFGLRPIDRVLTCNAVYVD